MTDLCEGKDRAVLSLFYTLSQFYKRAPSTNNTTSQQHSPAATKLSSAPAGGATSRIARPVSPGLKASHGVTPNGHTTSPVSPHAPHGSSVLSSPHTSGPRRTAGSSITSTTFDKLYMQPRKPLGNKPGDEDQHSSKGTGTTGGDTKPVTSTSSEVKSDPETESVQSPKQIKGSRLAKHQSFSFGHAHSTAAKESRLAKPGPSKSTPPAEVAESTTPPTNTKSLAGVGKLQGPSTQRAKESATGGDAPKDASSNGIPQRPSSRLKMSGGSGGGRSTPSNMTRSGLQRPSSRLSKASSNSATNLTEAEEAEKKHSLQLQRKGSDGVVKRHLVRPAKSPVPSHSLVQSGSLSLPRNLPKNSTGEHTSELETSTSSAESTGVKGHQESAPIVAETVPLAAKERASTMSSGSGLKRPGGVKRAGSLLSGVRTPNLPSGPHGTTTTAEGESKRAGTTSNTASPVPEKKLPQQQLKSKLQYPNSPIVRHKPLSSDQTPSATFTSNEPSSPVGAVSEEIKAQDDSKIEPNADQKDTKEELKIKEKEVKQQEVKPMEQEVKLVESVKQEVKSAEEEIKEKVSATMAGDHHLRFGRRISPEGMSHEEIIGPKSEGSPPSSSVKEEPPSETILDKSSDAESAASSTETDKQEQSPPAVVEGNARQSRLDAVLSGSHFVIERARSLSPKSPFRLMPRGMNRVRVQEGLSDLKRSTSSDSTSSEGTPSHTRKPLKSSLRQRGDSKSRHSSSSSSGEGSSPRTKVTISPRSSQVLPLSLTLQSVC